MFASACADRPQTVAIRGRAVRRCLRCGKPFPSKSPSNRICAVCTRINAKLARYPAQLLERQRGRKYLNGEPLQCS